jgi:hypothetical protein
MPRKGIRTVGRGRQTRNCAVHVGIEDSVAKDQQESLQDLREFEKSRLTFGQTARPEQLYQHTSTSPRKTLSPASKLFGYRASGISPIVETRASLRQAKPLRFNILSLDTGLLAIYTNLIQTTT